VTPRGYPTAESRSVVPPPFIFATCRRG